ncbi:hypothetical protein D9M68_481310 [compost metagenome]
MRVAGQVLDRAIADAGQAQVDQHLRQALVAVAVLARSTHQCAHVLRPMRVGGPDLTAVQAPPGLGAHGAGAHAGEVGTGVGLAHADGHEDLATHHARDEEIALRRRAELQDQRGRLAVGEPVRRHRRAGGDQFLHQYEAGKGAAAGTTILLRQGEPEPALPRERAAEVGVVAHPRAGTHVRRHLAQGLLQEGADRRAQRFVIGRDGDQRQGFEV